MTECHGRDCEMSLRVRLRLVGTRRARCALSKYTLVKTLSLRPPARRAVVPGSQPCMLRPLLHQHERSVVRLGVCGIGYFAPVACDLSASRGPRRHISMLASSSLQSDMAMRRCRHASGAGFEDLRSGQVRSGQVRFQVIKYSAEV